MLRCQRDNIGSKFFTVVQKGGGGFLPVVSRGTQDPLMCSLVFVAPARML